MQFFFLQFGRDASNSTEVIVDNKLWAVVFDETDTKM